MIFILFVLCLLLLSYILDIRLYSFGQLLLASSASVVKEHGRFNKSTEKISNTPSFSSFLKIDTIRIWKSPFFIHRYDIDEWRMKARKRWTIAFFNNTEKTWRDNLTCNPSKYKKDQREGEKILITLWLIYQCRNSNDNTFNECFSLVRLLLGS